MRILFKNKHNEYTLIETDSVGVSKGYFYFSHEYLVAQETSIYARADFRFKLSSDEIGKSILYTLLEGEWLNLEDESLEIYNVDKREYIEY